MNGFSTAFDASTGVATLTMKMPGKVNKLNREFGEGFAAALQETLAFAGLKGIILESGHKDFCAGADIDFIYAQRDPAALEALVQEMHATVRALETCGKPVVALLAGSALGGGYEIALACHRRIAVGDPRIQFGLPEVTLGVIPGGGGTQRLPRLIGIQAALEHIAQGKIVRATSAQKAGLVDETVADVPAARAVALAWIAANPRARQPWDHKSFTWPGVQPDSPDGRNLFAGGAAMLVKKTAGAYRAPEAAVKAVYEGAHVGFDAALAVEARYFANVVVHDQAKDMIRTFWFHRNQVLAQADLPKVADQRIQKVGILGAGMMGAGIAYVSAMAGIEVVLIDAAQDAAERGKAYSANLLDKAISRRKSTDEKKAEVLARITPTTDYAALKGCDLIVEAVFEDPGVKAEVTKKAEAAIPEDAIFATNTSTLPISDLARASTRPEQFIGIHFFSPVDKMALVEIIKGRQTGPRAVAKALDFVRQIRKTPIVVNDARFFYANRCILPYINEGIRMVGEGVSPTLIENAAKLMGMPLGPLQLVDETSIDLGVKIAKATKAAMGDAYADDDVDQVVFRLADQGRMGRKAKAGFYDYDEAGKRQGIWPGLEQEWPVSDDQPELSEVQHRLMLAQSLEAVRAFEDGVLEDIREGDVGAILGWGFAPWSGGPFGWLDMLGAARAAEIADQLTAKFGRRFATPKLLRDLAATGDSFYGRFGAGQKAA